MADITSIKRFASKVVVITGAASGTGESAARRFAVEGATLVLGDRDAEGLAKVVSDLDGTVETLDIAGVIAFLASEDARFVSGVNLPVDGGLNASNGQPPLS